MPNPTLPPEAGEVIDLPESVVVLATRAILGTMAQSPVTDEQWDSTENDPEDRATALSWGRAALLAALPHFHALVLEEREACAKVAEWWVPKSGMSRPAGPALANEACPSIAGLIRDRQP